MKIHPLLIIFLIGVLLKIVGVINWSWWIIAIPLYIIPITIAFIVLVISIIFTIGVFIDY